MHLKKKNPKKMFSHGILLYISLAGDKDCSAPFLLLEIQLITSLLLSVMETIQHSHTAFADLACSGVPPASF